MGIQSTRYVTRKRAEEMYVEKVLESQRTNLARLAAILPDDELEEFIEEEFDNYAIVSEVNPDAEN